MKFRCTAASFKGTLADGVSEFDAYENFEQLNEFYGSFDKKFMCAKEAYFQSAPPRDVWTDYVICDGGQIIARAAIWKYSPTAWEVAAVSTLPEHRGKGYGEMLVGHCTAIILSNGIAATCTTEDTNAAMQRVLEKVGFAQTE
jgi:predicted GNAT family acetyltransferase